MSTFDKIKILMGNYNVNYYQCLKLLREHDYSLEEVTKILEAKHG